MRQDEEKTKLRSSGEDNSGKDKVDRPISFPSFILFLNDLADVTVSIARPWQGYTSVAYRIVERENLQKSHRLESKSPFTGWENNPYKFGGIVYTNMFHLYLPPLKNIWRNLETIFKNS